VAVEEEAGEEVEDPIYYEHFLYQPEWLDPRVVGRG
jgi:hypothetical protein